MDEYFNIGELIARVESLVDLGRLDEAAQLISVGLSHDPNNYALLCLMAHVMTEFQEWRLARSYASSAISVEPEQAWAHRILSIVWRGGLQRHEAVKAAQEAVRLEPEDPVNWQLLVAHQLHVFDLAGARASAEHLRELAPYWSVSYQALAMVALEEENYAEAEEYCRKELEIDPNSYEGMNNLGIAQLNQKRKRDAVHTFHQAAKIDPVQDLARHNLQFAVSEYLPQFGAGLGALIFFVQIVRLFDGLWAKRILLFAVGTLVAVGIGFVFLRWYRFRRLPSAVRQYFQFATAGQRRENRRKIFIMTAIGCAGLFGVWWVIVWAFWEEFQKNWSFWLVMIPPAVMCVIGAGGWLAQVLNRSKD